MIKVSYSEPNIWFDCEAKDSAMIERAFASQNIPCNIISMDNKDFVLVDSSLLESKKNINLNVLCKEFLKQIRVDETYKEYKRKRDGLPATDFVIEVGPVRSKIVGPIKKIPTKEIKQKLSYFLKAAVNTNAYKNGHWDGTISLYDGRSRSFLSGMLDDVRDIFRKKELSVTVKYTYDTELPRQFDWKAKELFPIADDQKEAINACIKAKRCVCKAPTGYGKTAVLARYLTVSFGVPTLFLANKKQLLDDAAVDFLNGIEGLEESDIGQIKDGKFCDSDLKHGIVKPIAQPIVVATIQSVAARLRDPKTHDVMVDYLNNVCKFIMVDETQAVGTKQWDTVLDECNAPYRVALSATPKRTSGDTMKIFAYFGSLAYSTTAQEQIEKGRLCELDIQYVVFDHGLYNFDDKNLNYSDAYEEFIMLNRRRNLRIVKEAQAMIDEGRFVLVLIQRVDHGLILKDLFIEKGLDPDDIRFIWGESANDARAVAIKEFRKGKFKVLIGSTIFDAGVNIPIISGVVLAGAGNSEITLVQRIGRGARTCDYEKDIGYLPDFMKESSGKVTKVVDILDAHIKFFTKQAKNRYNIAREEFGGSRVRIVGGTEQDFSMSKKIDTSVPKSLTKEMQEQMRESSRLFDEFWGNKK